MKESWRIFTNLAKWKSRQVVALLQMAYLSCPLPLLCATLVRFLHSHRLIVQLGRKSRLHDTGTQSIQHGSDLVRIPRIFPHERFTPTIRQTRHQMVLVCSDEAYALLIRVISLTFVQIPHEVR